MPWISVPWNKDNRVRLIMPIWLWLIVYMFRALVTLIWIALQIVFIIVWRLPKYLILREWQDKDVRTDL